MTRFRAFVLCAAALGAVPLIATQGCAPVGGETPARPQRIALLPAGTKVPAPADGSLSTTVSVEVVWRDADRQRGLGGRTVLGEDAGMLFVYKDDRPRAFWMKDCYIGLDIAHLDAAGTVVKLATLPPGAGAAPGAIPQAPSVKPCRYVLEVNAGWFSRRGLGEGTVVDVSGVVAGIVPE